MAYRFRRAIIGPGGDPDCVAFEEVGRDTAIAVLADTAIAVLADSAILHGRDGSVSSASRICGAR